LFLTPYIIRSRGDLKAIYERKIRERQEFIDRYVVANASTYDVPLDYSRTRGLLGEIVQELRMQDEERKQAADSQAKPVAEHAPRGPITPELAHEPNS
jgi:general secretion pathway protein D